MIKKLVKVGKHAELWTSKPNQNQNQSSLKNNVVPKQDKSIKNKQKFPLFGAEEPNNVLEQEDEDDEELRLLRQRANQLGFLRNGNNVKKGAATNATASNKVNQNVGIDPKAKAMAALMSNLSVGGRNGNMNMNNNAECNDIMNPSLPHGGISLSTSINLQYNF